MKRLFLAVPLAIAGATAVMLPAPAHAQRHISPQSHPAVVTTVFHLQVTGMPAAGTTFWVAYGPLQGRWGVIRLLPRGGGGYSASASLPATGRTTLAYLAAQGVVQTRMGPAPGGIPVTIKLLQPVTPAAASRLTVRWQVPLG